MHPFTGLATREDGAIKVCCRSLPIGNIKDMSLEEAWNSDAMKEVRRQVLNGERPAVCQPCFDLEDQGVQSLRQRHITDSSPESRINLYPNALDSLSADYSMPFELPTMEIKINNLCNLKCRMCNPLDSTQWKDWSSIVSHYEKEGNYLVDAVKSLGLEKAPYVGLFEDKLHFWENLEKLLPYFKRVEFAGGEPLMDPSHYKILDLLSKNGKNIEIKYATNGTTLGIKGGRTVHEYWPKFKSVAVNVSIDGLHDTYEYIRGNGKFSDVEYNIKEMKKIPSVSRIVGAFTVQANNILQIEAGVAPKDIAYVRIGQEAKVSFTAYDMAIYGQVDGTVTKVAANSSQNEDGTSFYQLIIEVDAESIADKQSIIIQPGMQCDVSIIGQERTVLSYLSNPITKLSMRALQE